MTSLLNKVELVNLVCIILRSNGFKKIYLRNKYTGKVRSILVKSVISYEDEIILIKFIVEQINAIQSQYNSIKSFNYDKFIDICLFPESFFWLFKSLILSLLKAMKEEILQEIHEDCIIIIKDLYDEKISIISSYTPFMNQRQFNDCIIILYRYWKLVDKKIYILLH